MEARHYKTKEEILPEVGTKLEYFWEFKEDSGFQYLTKLGWEDGDSLEVVHKTEDSECIDVVIVLNKEPSVLTTAIIADPKFFIKPLTEEEKIHKSMYEYLTKNISFASDSHAKSVVDYLFVKFDIKFKNGSNNE